MEQLELLWYLQEVDISILELERELEEDPLISAVNKLEDKLKNERSSLEEIGERIKRIQKETKDLDFKLQKAVDEIKKLRKGLYGGEVANVRELEVMEKKLTMVEKDKEALENNIIEQIEEQEKTEKDYEVQKESVNEHEKKLDVKSGELKEQLAKTGEKISELKVKRKGILSKINEDYLEKYKMLTQRPDKKGVARVINDICEGCRVFISSAQRGKLYNPETLVYCENCGRLLVKFREDLQT